MACNLFWNIYGNSRIQNWICYSFHYLGQIYRPQKYLWIKEIGSFM